MESQPGKTFCSQHLDYSDRSRWLQRTVVQLLETICALLSCCWARLQRSWPSVLPRVSRTKLPPLATDVITFEPEIKLILCPVWLWGYELCSADTLQALDPPKYLCMKEIIGQDRVHSEDNYSGAKLLHFGGHVTSSHCTQIMVETQQVTWYQNQVLPLPCLKYFGLYSLSKNWTLWCPSY